ncbi:MAG: outer membrane beta-barrel protein [Kiritimatiellae bacterium]|nr:outer membrane beta-barrel protein [Kiritimatiellia bacterium]
MKKIEILCAAAVLAAFTMDAAAEFRLSNRIRFGYDDNIYQTEKNEKDSLRIIEEIEATLNQVMDNTYVGITYRPSLLWVEARDGDDLDVLHNLNFNLIQEFTPRLTLDLSDTLRAGQLPEVTDGDYVVRQDEDNIYNAARASLMYEFRPGTRLDLSGRWLTLRYTDEWKDPATGKDLHDFDNYNSGVAGLSLRQQLGTLTTLSGDLRYQMLEYEDSPEGFNRDSDMVFAGLGIEQTFSPSLLGNLRAGVEQRMYDDSKAYDDQTMPYAEGSLTWMPSPATRLTLAASYSISESDITNYMSQNRTYASLSLAHDFTSRMHFYCSAAYTHGEYEKDYANKSMAVLEDGDEDSVSFAGRLSFQVAPKNWLELNYQFIKLDSDFAGRQSFDNNRVDVAWKIQIL